MSDLISVYFWIFIMAICSLKPINWFLEQMHNRSMEKEKAHLEERKAYYDYVNRPCEEVSDE